MISAAWHPLSPDHIYIITATALELWHVEQPEGPEASVALPSPAAAHSFGSQDLWQLFTVFVLLQDGSVHTVCPLLPAGALVPRGQVLKLVSDVQETLADAELGAEAPAASAEAHWQLQVRLRRQTLLVYLGFGIIRAKKQSAQL